MYDVVQIAGSLLILAAFIAATSGRIDQSTYGYLTANAVGSAVLTCTAIVSEEWGFLLLEAVWAAVSVGAIATKASAGIRLRKDPTYRGL